jgi:hypothetical protein
VFGDAADSNTIVLGESHRAFRRYRAGVPRLRSTLAGQCTIDEHRRLFARIANLDGVAAPDWTVAAEDALRLNATSVPVRGMSLGLELAHISVDAAFHGEELCDAGCL